MTSDDLPTVSDLLAASGALPEDASLDAVLSWLGTLRTSMNGAPPVYRQAVREGALSVLKSVEAVSSAAKLADSLLAPPARPATELQGAALTFDDPDPWPEPVDGAELLDELAETAGRFLSLPDGGAEAIALWVMHAHAHGASEVSPVLAITSPTHRCGKTTLLELLSALTPRPLPAANLTPATVFRAVERFQPTLLVDEGDTFLHSDELRGVLNSGHRRSLARVVRTVGEDFEPRVFSTWSPKAVAAIGDLPNTLADRSVEVRMTRKSADDPVERLRLDRLEEGVLEPLRSRAWRWAQDHLDELRMADPDLPRELHDRARDNFRPLVAIADAAGGDWPERACAAAVTLSARTEGEAWTRGQELLRDVREVFDAEGVDQLPTRRLVAKLHELEERPWGDERGGRGLSACQLARMLKPFGLSSTPLWVGHGAAGRMLRGWRRAELEPVWGRYTPPTPGDPPSEAARVQEPVVHADSEAVSSRKARRKGASSEPQEELGNPFGRPAPGDGPTRWGRPLP